MPRFWKIVNSVQFSWVQFKLLGDVGLSSSPPRSSRSRLSSHSSSSRQPARILQVVLECAGQVAQLVHIDQHDWHPEE